MGVWGGGGGDETNENRVIPHISRLGYCVFILNIYNSHHVMTIIEEKKSFLHISSKLKKIVRAVGGLNRAFQHVQIHQKQLDEAQLP